MNNKEWARAWDQVTVQVGGQATNQVRDQIWDRVAVQARDQYDEQ